MSTSMLPFQAVIFDLDGTLFDSSAAIVAGFYHVFDRFGQTRPPQQVLLRGIGRPLTVSMAALGVADVDAYVACYREYYNANAIAQTKLLPGAPELLGALGAAGVAMGFATSRKRQSAEAILAHFGLLHHFKSRIGPYEVTEPKPAPECVLKSLDQLGANAEEALFVGDMPYDVEAAQAAGVTCYAVSTGYADPAELETLGPHRIFPGLPEIQAHLFNGVAQP